jgi:hypothetical protein
LKIDYADPPALNFASSAYLTPSKDSPQSIALENIGNAALEFSIPLSGQNPSISSSFTLGDNGSDCPVLDSSSSTTTLPSNSSCDLSISFTPQAIGTISGSLVLTDNALNANQSHQSVSLAGAATQAISTITWLSPTAITYGTALSATQLNATADVPGNFTYSPALGTVLNAGTQTLSVTFTPTDAVDYTTATSTVKLLVNPAVPSVTWPTPTAITYGTALSAIQLNATASVAGTFTYSPVAGIMPPFGTTKLSVVFNPTDATDYTTASSSVDLNVINPLPILSTLSPAVATAGGSAFTLTVSGSGFDPNSVVYWGTTALVTQFVNGTQLTAQVAGSSIATPGTASITVQTPAPGGGTSGAMQFEIDSASSTGPPQFSVVTATVTAGSSASYPVTLPASASNVTVRCLNLPPGAACSYVATSGALTITTSSTTPKTSGALTITTSSTTPKGTYQITIVFTETLPGTAIAWLAPFLLLPLANVRRKLQLRRSWLILVCAVACAITVFGVSGCGGSGGHSTPTHQITSSGTVTLNVQ